MFWPHFEFIAFRGYCLSFETTITSIYPSGSDVCMLRCCFLYLWILVCNCVWFFLPFALTVHSMLVTQHTEINFHLGAWWIIIAIFRCLGLYILRCFYFLCTWFLYSRLIKKSFPLTMAISIVCRASLGIFGEVLFIEISDVNDTHTHKPKHARSTPMNAIKMNTWMKDKYCAKMNPLNGLIWFRLCTSFSHTTPSFLLLQFNFHSFTALYKYRVRSAK